MISVKDSVKFLYFVMDRKQFLTATLLLWLVDTWECFLQLMSYHTSGGWVRKPMRPLLCHLEILFRKIFPLALEWFSDNTELLQYLCQFWTMQEGEETGGYPLTVININQALVKLICWNISSHYNSEFWMLLHCLIARAVKLQYCPLFVHYIKV